MQKFLLLNGAVMVANVTAISLLGFSPAQAVVVTVNGTDYDITKQSTTYNASQSLLQSQPWWGDPALATTFANAVGSQLGGVNIFGAFGPAFATSATSTQVSVTAFLLSTSAAQSTAPFMRTERVNYAFAQIVPPSPSAVPGPLPLFGAATAFGLSRRLRRRIRLAS